MISTLPLIYRVALVSAPQRFFYCKLIFLNKYTLFRIYILLWENENPFSPILFLLVD